MNRDDELDLSALDLSVLDATRDGDHWRAFVDATVERMDAVLSQRRVDALAQIAGWQRPLLIAASVAVLLLVPVELALETRELKTEQVERLVSLSVAWGHGESEVSASDFLRALAPEERP